MSVKFLSFFSSFLLPFIAFASVPIDALSRDLRLGDDNQEVKILQELLNRQKETAIVSVGDGAPGQETTYFGLKTRAALIKWQKKFEISGERGWAGPKTRQAMLNKYAGYLTEQWMIYGTKQEPKLLAKNKSQTITVLAKTKNLSPKITSLLPSAGGNSVGVTIRGENFSTASNTVRTSYTNLSGVPSADGKTLNFFLNFPTDPFFDEETGQLELPGNLTIPISISVVNNGGSSNELFYELKI